MTYTLTYEIKIDIDADDGWDARDEGWEIMKDACQNRLEFQLIDVQENQNPSKTHRKNIKKH